MAATATAPPAATANGMGLTANITEHAQKLLDFNEKLDINLLDNIVGCMYTREGQQVRSLLL